MTAQTPVYFTDENTLGLGKLLRRAGRDDVIYPGHEDLPEVPVGTPDLDWMPVVAYRQLIVVTRDRRIRTRPVELRAYWGTRDQVGVDRRQAGPWTAPTGRLAPSPRRTTSTRGHQARTRPVGAGDEPLRRSPAHSARALEMGDSAPTMKPCKEVAPGRCVHTAEPAATPRQALVHHGNDVGRGSLT
ncbi:PIN-like domain-containing protein [Nocardioides terrisoli]|uniref:PIN-like domain-containing protein n=1 Tax=Nocardioides terrisoli TaxID=3388267 RepID=UPI0037C776ED